MKRSEMIDIISEFLDNHVTQDTGYAWKYSKESSDTLLNMMEEAGMLPPSIATEGFLANLHKRHKDKHLIWEPEDG